MTEPQAFIFEKKLYTPTQARAWLKKYNIKEMKMDNPKFGRYYHFRIKDPNYFTWIKYLPKELGPGIKMKLGTPKAKVDSFERPSFNILEPKGRVINKRRGRPKSKIYYRKPKGAIKVDPTTKATTSTITTTATTATTPS
jgi:hypothetical protein